MDSEKRKALNTLYSFYERGKWLRVEGGRVCSTKEFTPAENSRFVQSEQRIKKMLQADYEKIQESMEATFNLMQKQFGEFGIGVPQFLEFTIFSALTQAAQDDIHGAFYYLLKSMKESRILTRVAVQDKERRCVTDRQDLLVVPRGDPRICVGGDVNHLSAQSLIICEAEDAPPLMIQEKKEILACPDDCGYKTLGDYMRSMGYWLLRTKGMDDYDYSYVHHKYVHGMNGHSLPFKEAA